MNSLRTSTTTRPAPADAADAAEAARDVKPAPEVVHVDGIPCTIEPGESILALLRRVIGPDPVPTLCDAPNLEPFGSCRVCSVEVALKEDGPTRVVASCHTPVAANSYITTGSPRMERLRRNIIELVLTDYDVERLETEDHGSNELHAIAREMGFIRGGGGEERTNRIRHGNIGGNGNGNGKSGGNANGNGHRVGNGNGKRSEPGVGSMVRPIRYPKGANHLDTPMDTSHPYMVADLSACIYCYRCVRACDEVQGEFVLSMSGRGFDSQIVMGAGGSFAESSCVSCGACAQACPTSAITDIFRSKENVPDKVERTVCTYCGVGCNLDVGVKDGAVTGITSPFDAEANHGHTCLKGRYAFSFYDHPDRLRTPLIRRNGALEPATWDEAYDYITEAFTRIIRESGPDAIAGISSARCPNEENYLLQKMMRAVVGTNNIDCCARVCHSPTALGMQRAFGTGAATNSIEDLDHTDTMLVIGANPTDAHPVTGARIKQQAMKGKTLIVIDPRRIELARYAQHHLQLRPGTNVALLNMFMYYLVTEGLVDRPFVEARCEGYEELEREILGVDITAMEAATGVPREEVRAAAIAYGSSPAAMSFHGLGVTEHSQGTFTVMQIADIAMMTGNIGRPGVGVNPLRGQNNVQGAADMGCQPHQGAGYLDVTLPEVNKLYSDFYGRPMPQHAGLKIPQMFDAAIAGRLKALWLVGEDVVQTDPNTKHVKKALDSLELLIVQELFMTPTAERAHVVLPGASFLEKSGTFTSSERRIQRVNKVVEPLEGTKPDGQIIAEIMRRMGYPQPDYDPATLLEEISAIVPFFAGVRWDDLGDNGKQWPVKPDGTDTRLLHTETFKRGRGRFHFTAWEETSEVTDHQKDYPYIVTTNRELEHYNSGVMTRRTRNVEILTEDVLLIHAKDAEDNGIADGDLVCIESPRGKVDIRARVSDQVKPGVMSTTFHFPDMMVNLLTSNVSDSEAMCPEYKVVSCRIRKARKVGSRVAGEVT